jgi:hypothetical protein
MRSPQAATNVSVHALNASILEATREATALRKLRFGNLTDAQEAAALVFMRISHRSALF